MKGTKNIQVAVHGIGSAQWQLNSSYCGERTIEGQGPQMPNTSTAGHSLKGNPPPTNPLPHHIRSHTYAAKRKKGTIVFRTFRFHLEKPLRLRERGLHTLPPSSSGVSKIMDRALTLCSHNVALKSLLVSFSIIIIFNRFPIELFSMAFPEPYLSNLLCLKETCSLALCAYVEHWMAAISLGWGRVCASQDWTALSWLVTHLPCVINHFYSSLCFLLSLAPFRHGIYNIHLTDSIMAFWLWKHCGNVDCGQTCLLHPAAGLLENSCYLENSDINEDEQSHRDEISNFLMFTVYPHSLNLVHLQHLRKACSHYSNPTSSFQ